MTKEGSEREARAANLVAVRPFRDADELLLSGRGGGGQMYKLDNPN